MEEDTQSPVPSPTLTSDSCAFDSSNNRDDRNDLSSVTIETCEDCFVSLDKPHSPGMPNGCINRKIDHDENNLVTKLGNVTFEDPPDKDIQIEEQPNNDNRLPVSCDKEVSVSESNQVLKESSVHQSESMNGDIEIASTCSPEETSTHENENSEVKECCKPLDPGMSELTSTGNQDTESDIVYVVYGSEKQMPDIMRLITKDLSEPYSIYTYRYFIHNWPKLCFLVSLFYVIVLVLYIEETFRMI